MSDVGGISRKQREGIGKAWIWLKVYRISWMFIIGMPRIVDFHVNRSSRG